MSVLTDLALATASAAVMYPNITWTSNLSTVTRTSNVSTFSLSNLSTDTFAPRPTTTSFYCPSCKYAFLAPANVKWTTDRDIPHLATTYLTVNAITNTTATSVKCNRDLVTASTAYNWLGYELDYIGFYGVTDDCQLFYRDLGLTSLGDAPTVTHTATVTGPNEFLDLGNFVYILDLSDEDGVGQGVSMTMPDGSLTCITSGQIGVSTWYPSLYTQPYSITTVSGFFGPLSLYMFPSLAKYYPGQAFATQCPYVNFGGTPMTLQAANYFTTVTTISAGLYINREGTSRVPGTTARHTATAVDRPGLQRSPVFRPNDPLAVARPGPIVSDSVPGPTPAPDTSPGGPGIPGAGEDVPAPEAGRVALPSLTFSFTDPIAPITTPLTNIPAVLVDNKPLLVSSMPITVGDTVVSLSTSAGTTIAIVDSPDAHTTIPLAALPHILGGRAVVQAASLLASSDTILTPNDGSVLTVVDDTTPGGYTQVLALDSPSTVLNAAPTLHVIAQSGNVRAYLSSHPEALAAIAQLLQQRLKDDPGLDMAASALSSPAAMIEAYVRAGSAVGIASSRMELDLLVAASRVFAVLGAESARRDIYNDVSAGTGATEASLDVCATTARLATLSSEAVSNGRQAGAADPGRDDRTSTGSSSTMSVASAATAVSAWTLLAVTSVLSAVTLL